MKQVRKSVLLWYSPAEMYELVTGVERYPEFLPWCDSATVLERREDGITARLGLAYMGVHQTFTTRNEQRAPESVAVHLVDGPFAMLEGHWQFRNVGKEGGPAQACKIEFELRWAFASALLETLISPAFDRIADTFVDSFVRRAEAIHGPR